MNYSDYSAEDFAMDNYFRQWIKHPDEENEQFWQSWLVRHPHKRELITKARQLVVLANFKEDLPTQPEKEQLWERIKTTRQQNSPSFQPATSYSFTNYRQWYKWAAIIAGILLTGGLLYLLNFKSDKHYSTAYGKTQQITLPDGSQVMLNANSTLKLSSTWLEGEKREVWLQGEAFFQILKKAAPTKFIVHTARVDVEVLGTAFNVSNRQANTQVVLSSGKVKLDLHRQTQQNSLVMVPGELVEISSQQEKVSKRIVKPELYTDWTNKQWILQNTTLSEVAGRLEQTFGLQVTFASADISQEEMTGIVSIDNLDELIEELAIINGLRISKKNNNQLYITR